MQRSVLVLLVSALLVSVAVAGETPAPTGITYAGGVSASAIPFFDGSAYLRGVYSIEGFEARARTTATVVPDFHLFQDVGVTFFPDDLTIGARAGLGIIPFGLGAVDVFAEKTVLESEIGEKGGRFIGVAGANLWLGRRFGGEIFFRAIGESAGDVPVAVTSITSVAYSEALGVGLEEELEVRARFFEGQMLADDDLSALVAYISGRCRLDGNGFGLSGVIVGIEVEFHSPLQETGD